MSHSPTPDVLALGVPGFTYADLYRPERLRDLHDVFLREVGAADADLAPTLGRVPRGQP